MRSWLRWSSSRGRQQRRRHREELVLVWPDVLLRGLLYEWQSIVCF
jgi:hypothetical protein